MSQPNLGEEEELVETSAENQSILTADSSSSSMSKLYVSESEAEEDATDDGMFLGAESIKVELTTQQQNYNLRQSLKKINERLGDEIISDSSSDESNNLEGESRDPDINTLHYQRDSFFAEKYFYITSVSIDIVVEDKS